MNSARRVVVAVAVALALVGCGRGDTSQQTAPSSSPASPSASATPSPGPASPSASLPDTAPSPARPPMAEPSKSVSPPPVPTAGVAATRYVFPVDGNVDYGHVHALYPATDIIAPCGATVRSAVDGMVIEVSRIDRFDPAHPDGATKGGMFVSILGLDGVRYYGAHLSAIMPFVAPGAVVKAGTVIGRIGHTGNANNICHLHFAISPPCKTAGDWWIRRGVIYPWRYLDSWRAKGQRSPAAEVAAWLRQHGCPAKPAGG